MYKGRAAADDMGRWKSSRHGASRRAIRVLVGGFWEPVNLPLDLQRPCRDARARRAARVNTCFRRRAELRNCPIPGIAAAPIALLVSTLVRTHNQAPWPSVRSVQPRSAGVFVSFAPIQPNFPQRRSVPSARTHTAKLPPAAMRSTEAPRGKPSTTLGSSC